MQLISPQNKSDLAESVRHISCNIFILVISEHKGLIEGPIERYSAFTTVIEVMYSMILKSTSLKTEIHPPLEHAPYINLSSYGTLYL